MTVEELGIALGCQTTVGGEALKKEVKGGYCGDLLSWVMGRAAGGSAWVTVMGNTNAIAVAVLADTACIILAQGAALDADACQKAVQNNVAVLRSEKSAFEIACGIYETLRK